jgi:hypothetical protein
MRIKDRGWVVLGGWVVWDGMGWDGMICLPRRFVFFVLTMHASSLLVGRGQATAQKQQQQQQQQQTGVAAVPPAATTAAAAAAATTAAADAALGRVRCLRVADDRDLLSALDCLGQRLLAGAEVRVCVCGWGWCCCGEGGEGGLVAQPVWMMTLG